LPRKCGSLNVSQLRITELLTLPIIQFLKNTKLQKLEQFPFSGKGVDNRKYPEYPVTQSVIKSLESTTKRTPQLNN
jgi:hypothetical protein